MDANVWTLVIAFGGSFVLLGLCLYLSKDKTAGKKSREEESEKISDKPKTERK